MPIVKMTVPDLTYNRLKRIKANLSLSSYMEVLVRATIALEIILDGYNAGDTFFRRNRNGSIKEIDFFKPEHLHNTENNRYRA